jgi:hypothetical protein
MSEYGLLRMVISEVGALDASGWMRGGWSASLLAWISGGGGGGDRRRSETLVGWSVGSFFTASESGWLKMARFVDADAVEADASVCAICMVFWSDGRDVSALTWSGRGQGSVISWRPWCVVVVSENHW